MCIARAKSKHHWYSRIIRYSPGLHLESKQKYYPPCKCLKLLEPIEAAGVKLPAAVAELSIPRRRPNCCSLSMLQLHPLADNPKNSLRSSCETTETCRYLLSTLPLLAAKKFCCCLLPNFVTACCQNCCCYSNSSLLSSRKHLRVSDKHKNPHHLNTIGCHFLHIILQIGYP